MTVRDGRFGAELVITIKNCPQPPRCRRPTSRGSAMLSDLLQLVKTIILTGSLGVSLCPFARSDRYRNKRCAGQHPAGRREPLLPGTQSNVPARNTGTNEQQVKGSPPDMLGRCHGSVLRGFVSRSDTLYLLNYSGGNYTAILSSKNWPSVALNRSRMKLFNKSNPGASGDRFRHTWTVLPLQTALPMACPQV
jgi:hypothetical protein